MLVTLLTTQHLDGSWSVVPDGEVPVSTQIMGMVQMLIDHAQVVVDDPAVVPVV